jgi:glycogen synthase
MKILYMVERFWPYIGGVEVASARVLPDLVRRGHEIVVVTSRDDPGLPEREEFQGITIHRLPLMQPLQARDPEMLVSVKKQLLALQQEVSPDVLHVLFTGATIYFLGSRRQQDAPTLVSFHGSWPGKADGFLAQALSSAAWVTACSQSALNDLHRMEPSVRHRSSAIFNGMDPPVLAPTPLCADPPVLVCAGRLVYEKGFDVALEALVEVARVHPATKLLIAGDGTERQALERQATDLGIRNCVEFLGWISPEVIPRLLNRSTIALIPSRREGFGLSALEAALMARPVVASRAGGLPEVVADGETGLLVGPEDCGALAGGILQLLDNFEEGQRMGRTARRRAMSEFSARRHADAYEQLYRQLASEERPVVA